MMSGIYVEITGTKEWQESGWNKPVMCWYLLQPEQGLLLTVFFFFVSLEFSVIKRFLKEEDEKEEEEGKGEEEL